MSAQVGSDEKGNPIPWTSGTLQDLDLSSSLYPWRLKAEAKARADAAAAKAAKGGGVGGGGAGRKAGGGGGRAASVAAVSHPSTMPVDPVRLHDSSLHRLKEGVRTPQMFHTITSVQVWRSVG